MGKLTGNIRYVLHSPMFGKPFLKVQVEERLDARNVVSHNGDERWVPETLWWRDARVEDLMRVRINYDD